MRRASHSGKNVTFPTKHSRGRAVGGKQRLRIIGGEWRRRTLNFVAAPGLRPTPERTRETLFNWLQGDIVGARCLDVFAGSGALGFEAASRGAAEVVFVEKSTQVVAQLVKMRQTLEGKEGITTWGRSESVPKISIQKEDALRYLMHVEHAFDVIFLDPPFRKGLLDKCLQLIKKNNVLNINGLVYVEGEKHLESMELFQGWTVSKKTRAGDSTAYLCQLKRI